MAPALELHIIIRCHAVEARHLVTVSDQSAGEVKSDEPRCPGYEILHSAASRTPSRSWAVSGRPTL